MSAPASTLRVGVDAAPPAPMCFDVPGGPEFKGFEVDLLRALGEHLGRPLAFHASLWTELLQRLDAGDLDLICTAATITPQRERRFLFSEPYLRTRLAVISRRNSPVGRLRGFSGPVGVREGTPAEAYIVNCGLQPSRFHFNKEIYGLLENGTLGAVVDDHPIGAWFAGQSAVLQVAPLAGTESRYGLVMRRDAVELKTAVNQALRTAMLDGSYARSYERWLKPLLSDACDVTAETRP